MYLRISTSSSRVAQLLHAEGATIIGHSAESFGKDHPRMRPGSHENRRPSSPLDDIHNIHDIRDVMSGGMMHRGGMGMDVPQVFEMVMNLASSPAGAVATAYGSVKTLGSAVDAVDKILGVMEKIKNLRETSWRSVDADITITGASAMSDAERQRLTDKAIADGYSISFMP